MDRYQRRERVLSLSLQIDAARRHLARLEAELDTLIQGERQLELFDQEPTGEDSIKLVDRILAVMNQRPNQALSNQEVISALPNANPDSIKMTLNRLYKRGVLLRPAPGNFELATEASEPEN